jgi:hypothetical protein
MAVTSPVETACSLMPKKSWPIVQVRHIGELAAQPVQGLDDDHVETAALGVDLHLPEFGSEPAGAALRVLGVDLDDGPALELGVAPADLDLILDRGLTLVVRAVAGVDGGAERLLV